METTIYLVRHGETEWNRKGMLQGQLESSLTTEGIEKTEALRPEITALNPDVIYSSDQGRAITTAQILTGDLNKEINLHPGLREMNFGVFQGHSWDWIEREMESVYNLYRHEGPDYNIPGGESHNCFHKRISDTLEEIIQENRGKKILIVSHGGSINKMLCYAENMEPSANRFFHTKNLALSVLQYSEGSFSLKTPVELVEFASIR